MWHTTRNLVIFTAVSLTAGFLGIALNQLTTVTNPMQGPGALLWLASPLVVGLLLRHFGGDGWADLGLNPHLKTGWHWYLVGVLIPVLVTAVVLLPAVLIGAADLSGLATQGLPAFLTAAMATFTAVMVKNIFEEFAWRGYLTPRFAARRLTPLLSALLTGLIWAGWHVPYYLYYLDRTTLTGHTPLSLPVFILLSFLVLPFHALAYGELRLLSGSVWPAWLMHNTANAISLSLISGSFLTLNPSFSGVLLSPSTEGLLSSLLMGLIGLGLYRRRQQTERGEVQLLPRS